MRLVVASMAFQVIISTQCGCSAYMVEKKDNSKSTVTIVLQIRNRIDLGNFIR